MLDHTEEENHSETNTLIAKIIVDSLNFIISRGRDKEHNDGEIKQFLLFLSVWMTNSLESNHLKQFLLPYIPAFLSGHYIVCRLNLWKYNGVGKI